MQTSQAYYNSHYTPTIGTETFNHAVGRPWTYPSRDEMVANAPSRWNSDEKLVGQTGTTTVSITVGTEYGSSMSESTQSEQAIGTGMGGVDFPIGWGTSEGISYEITSTSETTFEGCIGAIQDAGEFDRLQYSFGLFTHQVTHPTAGNSYLVINYFVEGVVEYYPPGDDSGGIVALALLAGLGVAGLAIVIRGQRRSRKNAKAAGSTAAGKTGAADAPVKQRAKRATGKVDAGKEASDDEAGKGATDAKPGKSKVDAKPGKGATDAAPGKGDAASTRATASRSTKPRKAGTSKQD